MDIEALSSSSSSCQGRAVILSSDRSLAQACRTDRLECIVVDSAYQAAAELLAAPTVALIVDLNLLTSRHLRLLEIARQMGMEMFGVGTLCDAMTADQLSGLRLVSRAGLPEAIKAVVDAELSQLQAPVEILPSPPPVRLTPAKSVETARQEDSTFLSDDTATSVQPGDNEQQNAAPAAADVEPLLTSEEIDALLGGER